MKRLKKIVKHFANLRPNLILSYAPILIIPSLAIGTLSFFTAKDTVEEKIKEGISENINLLNASIHNAIDPKIEKVHFLSERINANFYKKEQILKLREMLSFYGQIFPEEVLSTYLGTTEGQFFQYPETQLRKDFDARKRDWFKAAMESPGEIIVSQPYNSLLNDGMVVTISKMTNDVQASSPLIAH